MNVGLLTTSAGRGPRTELERLLRALSKENDRASGSLHFGSTNWEQVETLHNALLLLMAAQGEILKLLASAPTPTEALTVVNRLASTLRTEMLMRWSLRQFRASEALARILTLVVEAEIGIRSSRQ